MIALTLDVVTCKLSGWELPLESPLRRKVGTTQLVAIKTTKDGRPYALLPGNTGDICLKKRSDNLLLAESSGWSATVVDGETIYSSTLPLNTDPINVASGSNTRRVPAQIEVSWTEPGFDDRSATYPFELVPRLRTGSETSPEPAAPEYPSASVVAQVIVDQGVHAARTDNPHAVTPAQLGLVIGTNVQAQDSTLEAISGGGTTGTGAVARAIGAQLVGASVHPALAYYIPFYPQTWQTAIGSDGKWRLTLEDEDVGTLETPITVNIDGSVIFGNPTATAAALGLEIGTDVQAYRAELVKIGVKGADIASAGTIDLGAATGDFLTITGTTPISALGTVAAGTERTMVFAGVLVVTHNSTSLILPGGASITTAAGDVMRVRSLGSGNWKCVAYSPASGISALTASFVASAISMFAGNPNIYQPAWLIALGIYNLRMSGTFAAAATTTLADITGLVSPTLAVSTTYSFRATVVLNLDANGGYKLALRLPGTSPTAYFSWTMIDQTALTIISSDKASAAGLFLNGATPTFARVEISGRFTTGSGSAGTAALQFAQNVASGESDVWVGSTFEIFK